MSEGDQEIFFAGARNLVKVSEKSLSLEKETTLIEIEKNFPHRSRW
jgi:hypothetical protein